MTMEEILAVVQKIKDAWVAFGQSMACLLYTSDAADE